MLLHNGGNVEGGHGINAYKEARIMRHLGAEYAINFDGGGSSTFWYNGEIKNNPSDGSERSIGSALLVLKK